MTQITLVRHGETDWNKNKIIQGRFDIPLNETGKQQAIQTAKHFNHDSFDVIYASPMIRAVETATIIKSEIQFNDEIQLNEKFIERDFGDADGKPIKAYYHMVHENNIANLESEETIKERVISGIKEIALKHSNQKILIVCHSHIIKACLTALNEEKYNFQYKLGNCSITDLHIKDDELTIARVNYNDFL